ncbi:MAG TPA: hypothetical protein VHT75_17105 [Acidimicrobiales bacterium]|jgi:hypothetical protein|nr:hypothetical protein [Acidimicrobiales bacterium]
MAVLLQQVLPEGVTIDMLDEVTTEMGIQSDPPAGLVVHVHYLEGGRSHVVDVWESRQAYETFEENRLRPAIQKVMERRGVTMGGQPETSMTEVASVMKG